ncbi:copper amine oxidase N-terminal domain-containing protein [Paenibacillus barcinonensis]|uniref:copper amine oxidase N-terminal domain-containing protein n=1 Tax=Paenibacillus barcinonensis TaxID=198119 RepID=UPI001C11471B|nr:copper amine oxidase N-terminal domain-containing protein [Paenibacillus barcinonensis]MBU5353383.1 copper amine oxidase N-terminal domain-containing protein [Paenibacillus barcinonensis]
MKKMMMFIAALCVVSVAGALYASTAKVSAAASTPEYSLMVNGRVVEVKRAEQMPYEQKGTVMVPLRATAESLGYKVSWIAADKAIRVEDSIQSVIVKDGSTQAKFTGKLKVINLTHDVELPVPVQSKKGVTYVPASFFEPFFNEVVVKEGNVSISAQMSSIQ